MFNPTIFYEDFFSALGQGAGIFIDEESNRMFISCTPNNYVSVIDLTSRKVIKKLEVGRPDGLTAVKVLE